MEVSALGGIIDTYEKELEEYKKQVFELMKQNDRQRMKRWEDSSWKPTRLREPQMF